MLSKEAGKDIQPREDPLLQLSPDDLTSQIHHILKPFLLSEKYQDIIRSSLKNFEQPDFQLQQLEKTIYSDLQLQKLIIQEHTQFKYGSKKKKVFLITGETGHGKSTLINALLHNQYAVEAKKGQSTSQTQFCSVYEDSECRIICIDTPGWFDTNSTISNTDICNKIIQKVQENLKGDSQIDGVVIIWSPTSSGGKFREALMEQLKAGLGEDVFKSLIFLINKRTKKWDDDEEGVAAQDAITRMRDYTGINVPSFISDIKQDENTEFKLMRHSEEVHKYKDAQFQKYRTELHLQLIKEELIPVLQRRAQQKQLEDKFMIEGKMRELAFEKERNEMRVGMEKMELAFREEKEALKKNMEALQGQYDQLSQESKQNDLKNKKIIEEMGTEQQELRNEALMLKKQQEESKNLFIKKEEESKAQIKDLKYAQKIEADKNSQLQSSVSHLKQQMEQVEEEKKRFERQSIEMQQEMQNIVEANRRQQQQLLEQQDNSSEGGVLQFVGKMVGTVLTGMALGPKAAAVAFTGNAINENTPQEK